MKSEHINITIPTNLRQAVDQEARRGIPGTGYGIAKSGGGESRVPA